MSQLGLLLAALVLLAPLSACVPSTTAEHASRFAGRVLFFRQLAAAYDLVGTDGSQSDCRGCADAHGIENHTRHNIEQFG